MTILCHFGLINPKIHVTLDISCYFGQCHKRPCFLLVFQTFWHFICTLDYKNASLQWTEDGKVDFNVDAIQELLGRCLNGDTILISINGDITFTYFGLVRHLKYCFICSFELVFIGGFFDTFLQIHLPRDPFVLLCLSYFYGIPCI